MEPVLTRACESEEPMTWTIEENQTTGAKELTDGRRSFPLTDKELETLKIENKAAVKKLIDDKGGTVGNAPTEEDLAGVRQAAGGAPFQSAVPVKRAP
jgi:hypothetical protein